MKIEKTSLAGKSLVSIHDLSRDEINLIFDVAETLKSIKGRVEILKGKVLGMIFEKSSTRTRVSFEVGMYQLGGTALFLSKNDIQLGRGETMPDTAKVLSRYVDGIMARTFEHQKVLDLVEYGSIPIINGLTDLLHPCQVLADLLTVKEHKGKLEGLKMAYLGDGNNMAHSLMYGCAKVGMHLNIASPSGYTPNEEVVKTAMEDAKATGSKIKILTDPIEAISDADVVYTDVWASMGQEEEQKERLEKFKSFQINSTLTKNAKPDHIVMHCLPAHRNEEISDEVLDGKHSVVFDEAENRLHAQKAVMALLMI